MSFTRIASTVRWVVITILLASSCCALLPRSLLGALITRRVARPSNLIIEVLTPETLTICLYDRSARLDFGREDPKLFAPIRMWLERQRLQSLIRYGQIAIWAQAENATEQVKVANCRTRDVWHPLPGIPVRCVLQNALKLPHGRYQIHAMLFADPPNGIGEMQIISDADNTNINKAAFPGAIVLDPTSTLPVDVIIEPQ